MSYRFSCALDVLEQQPRRKNGDTQSVDEKDTGYVQCNVLKFVRQCRHAIGWTSVHRQ